MSSALAAIMRGVARSRSAKAPERQSPEAERAMAEMLGLVKRKVARE